MILFLILVILFEIRALSYSYTQAISNDSINLRRLQFYKNDLADQINQIGIQINQMLPLRVGNFYIQKLSWNDFQGPPLNDKYDANIYFTVNDDGVVIDRRKSWVRQKNQLLLIHEQGHYLLSYLCVLEKKYDKMEEDLQSCQYLRNITYDRDTMHGVNLNKQLQYLNYIQSMIFYYSSF